MPATKLRLLLLVAATWSLGLLCPAAGEAGGGSCELSVARGGALYNFSLAAPTPAHRHGVLSEDGFYKVAMNDSVIWFQLCDQMIFNFDPPVCLRCEDCGGPLRCGTQCSALVSHYIRGYDVCTTIGRASESRISLIDESNPQKGVIVKMSSSKCSISVFIFCDSAVVQLPDKFSHSGNCDYATVLRHPSGCARSVSSSGNGWGWLRTSFITMLCLFGGYILIGAIYRYYFLGIRSIEAIPNMEFWVSLPQKVKSVFVPSTRNPRSRSRDSRGPYAPVNN
ncbi:uncharacterized protein LOC124698135 [Lolium rigidum]|uniref:uncharacterized protein LOC124698135 n=1 Tax=Lolium rigidum TaxID=89674 RepID=UPI001F5C4DCD|nr:uncharacterized protein LOC124698135 [Lolium rigidum]